MLGKSKRSNPQSSLTSGSSSNNIGVGASFTGDLNAAGDIRIDGTLEGNLSCEGRVIIGAQGHVKGTISCEHAVIDGRFIGDLHCRESLIVNDSSTIDGDVRCGKLSVSPGAQFNVSCNMGAMIAIDSAPEAVAKRRAEFS